MGEILSDEDDENSEEEWKDDELFRHPFKDCSLSLYFAETALFFLKSFIATKERTCKEKKRKEELVRLIVALHLGPLPGKLPTPHYVHHLFELGGRTRRKLGELEDRSEGTSLNLSLEDQTRTHPVRY